MKKTLLLKVLVIVFVFVGFLTGANAQVTTSSMTGTIKDSKEALPGASIKATHTPTGTVYSALTNASGRFLIGNMRIGGPYSIEVSFIGFKPQKLEDVYLKLGETFTVNLVLTDNASVLKEVVISGSKVDPIMNSKKSGASTIISRAKIEELPSITRSVNDVTRLTPQANGTSIGGGSYRSNNFTVDGANFNNQFGIGQNIPANGSPISIDALEEISVNVTPFDVRQTGFTGASVNAVTRSGKNTFFGNALYTLRSEKQQGVRVNNNVITNLQQLDEKQYGFSLGGPIIKNKLFFFVNLESRKTVEPGPTKVASVNGVENSTLNIARPSAAFMDQVSQYLASTYGYETGAYQGYSNKSNNDKIFARLDWNINSKHRFNIRYSQVESKSPSQISTSTSGSNFTASDNRQSIYSMSFFNSNYFQEANLYAGTAELNSNFGKINNSLRVSYAHQNDPRSSPGSEFPLVDILDKGLTSPRTGNSTLVSFGYEPFTFGNLRDVTTYTVNDDLTFTTGKHNFTFGAQAEMSKVKNGFQRFGTGYYVFNTWDDFVNGAKPVNFALTYPLTADGSQAFPSFKFFQLSAYGQDDISVSDKFKVTLGLRLELPTYPDVSEIKTHPLVEALSFNAGEKINTGVLPKSRLMFSPRIGFNYDILGDRSVQLRGGSGVFTGRIPFVWIVAQSGDAGLIQFTQSISGATNPNMPNFNPNYKSLYPATLPAAGTSIPSSISAMSPDLKFPQQWKSSLGLDAKLPFGFIGTIEMIYGKDINSVVARNANLNDPTPLNISGYPDNRLIFPAGVGRYINKLSSGVVSPTGTGNFDAIVMYNVKGGHYFSTSFQLTKPFGNNWDLTAAYTYSSAKNFGDQAGDQILNLWSIPYQSGGNSNVAELSYTSNVLPHRVVSSVGYKSEWIKGLKTGMSLFYQGGSQGRYSYFYSSDFNKDNQINDLIYVPKDPSEITFVANGSFTPAQQSEAFFKLIESDEYLKSRKGMYAERNGAVAPWRHQFDFRFSQELYRGKVAGSSNALELFFDVFNVGNLINSKWGTFSINNANVLAPVTVTPGGTSQPTFRLNTVNNALISESNRINTSISSTYYMQFGFRYNFN
ncbi:TonB-dependent receptor [Pedobacter sp. Du54]|uniref:TonB-dependent receptor n=1 Tax=Pedobacter anseongensis TaxID=3133439 RepID=UPI0030A5C045